MAFLIVISRWIIFAVFLSIVIAGQNNVLNPGFEYPLSGLWEAVSFQFSLSADARTGMYSGKSYGRTRMAQGPAQLVNLVPGRLYNFTSYIKQMNDMPGKLFQSYTALLSCHYSDTDNTESFTIVNHRAVSSKDGWVSLAGFFRMPTRATDWVKLRFQSPDPEIDFLLDDVILVELADNVYWKKEADDRIQRLRTANIHFNFTLGPGIRAADIEVEVDHKTHSFGFGSLFQDRFVTPDNRKGYRDLFFKMFNIGTTQRVKWLLGRGNQTHPDFSQALATIKLLKDHGVKVRAHNLFWGFTKNLPSYVINMKPGELNRTVYERLNYMVNITKGQVDHWDVMNELLHGQWFEETMKDPTYTNKLYTELRRLDPKPMLFLNDFAICSLGEFTDAYLHQAKRFLTQKIPLDALGVQSHFKTQKPDPDLLLLRLNHLAQAGLPIWITELDLLQENKILHANYLEDVLRVYFSHPSVQGIVLWGFSDQEVNDTRAALAETEQYTLNEAGQRYLRLIKKEWSTHVSKFLSSESSFSIQGFKGTYEVTVKKAGVPITTGTYSALENEVTFDINVH